MSKYVDNKAGTSTTTGTGSFVISGSLGDHHPMIGNLTNGAEYSYKCVYADGTTAGYETGRGVWTSSTNTLTRVTIKTSSAGGTTKVSWSGATLAIYIVLDTHMMGQLAKDRFSYKADSTTPIFLVITGQSNGLGIEAAATDFPLNTHVWDYQCTTTTGSPLRQPTTPASFTFRNPDPSESLITNGPYDFVPYVGYLRGGTGHRGMAMAGRLQETTGRDVYVLSICSGGAGQYQWRSGGLGLARILLESFVPYILANTAALADVDAPDIVVWAQGETDADPAGGAFFTAPLTYASRAEAIRAAADSLWSDNDITTWIINEPTQQWNWTEATAMRWEGINAWARYSPEKVIFVGSHGLEGEVADDYIHFLGDDNNEYGYRNADAVFNHNPAQGPHSIEVKRDANPILGGNLDANSKNISGVGTYAGASIALTGALTAASANFGAGAGAVTMGALTATTGSFSSTLGVTGAFTATASIANTAGIFTSGVTDAAGHIGYKLSTVSMTNNTSVHTAFYNNTTLVLQINPGGYIEAPLTSHVYIRPAGYVAASPTGLYDNSMFDFSVLGTDGSLSWLNNGTWTFNTATASGNGPAYLFDTTGGAMATSDILVNFKSNAAGKARINVAGFPYFGGTTAPPTARVSTGTTGTFAAGSSTAAKEDSTWNGGSGTGYNMHDVVKTLKNVGLLA